MNNKRVPLSNVPNAANSPFRAVAAAASKRSRDQVEQQADISYDIQPRAKRQALENSRGSLRTPPRKQALQSAEGRIFNGRQANVQPTAFERKLLAAREDKSQQRIERQEKSSTEALDAVKQWQRNYKKSFPLFVFYFESVPEDVRLKCSRWIRQFGAVSLASKNTWLARVLMYHVIREKKSSFPRRSHTLLPPDPPPPTTIIEMQVIRRYRLLHRQAHKAQPSLVPLIHPYWTVSKIISGSRCNRGISSPLKFPRPSGPHSMVFVNLSHGEATWGMLTFCSRRTKWA